MDGYECGKSYPSPSRLVKIADYLDVPLEYFFDDYYRFIFNNYSKVIRIWRERNNFTIADIAKIIGVYTNTFRNWELGKRYPNRIHYLKLVKFIGI